jgi:peptide-methionine (S)-S-oxide reductase
MATQGIPGGSRSRVGMAGRYVTMMLLMLGLLTLSGLDGAPAAEQATVIPPPAADDAASGTVLQSIVLAGGCFWGIQAVYQHVEGVHQAISGYAGGVTPNPSYEQVSSGRTGYAEAVEVTFDPRKISLGKILQIFLRRA